MNMNAGYMLKLIVFGSFYHPFQDGYKKFPYKQIFFPWLVQAREIKVVPETPSAVFSVCQNCYQKLVFCWHVFLTDTQISNS